MNTILSIFIGELWSFLFSSLVILFETTVGY